MGKEKENTFIRDWDEAIMGRESNPQQEDSNPQQEDSNPQQEDKKKGFSHLRKGKIKTMKILELFSGTESFSKVARARGHETITVDNNFIFKPDIQCDVLNLKFTKEFNNIDIIWASPPCTCFSVASIGSSWIGNYHPKRVETALAMAYVLKTLWIIKQLKPKFWIIENPRGVLRKMGFMEGLPRTTACYCKYGDKRMKPTDIWNNIGFKGKMCKNGNPCHIPAPRGSKTGTQGLKGNMERSVVPEELCLEIIKLCEDSI